MTNDSNPSSRCRQDASGTRIRVVRHSPLRHRSRWQSARHEGSRTQTVIAALVLATTVQFDHLWIVVSRDAPERVVLEKAGFRVAPEVNKHDGQGTASVMLEFQNSFLELVWPDPTVPISPGME